MAKKSKKPQGVPRLRVDEPREYDPVADYLARLIVIEGELSDGTIAEDAKALEEAVATAMEGWEKPSLGAGFPAELSHSLAMTASQLPAPRNVTEGLPLLLSSVRLYARCVRAYLSLADITGGALGTEWGFAHMAAIFAEREMRLVTAESSRGQACIEALATYVFEMVTRQRYAQAERFALLLMGLGEATPLIGWLGGAAVAVEVRNEALARLVVAAEGPQKSPGVDSKDWMLGRALAAYFLQGDSEVSRALRDEAMAASPAAGALISGRVKPARNPKDLQGVQAAMVLSLMGPAVNRLPGARSWFAASPA